METQGIIARCAKSDEGSILVFFAVALAVILGIVGLSFDLGRIAITQTELQSYADNVALSAAGELDGNPGARARAQQAANVIASRQSFADGDNALGGGGDFTLVFLRSLPDLDTSPVSDVATSDADAKYVQAIVRPRDVGFTFAQALGPRGPAVVSANAIATSTLYACDITPLMFCMPQVNNIKEGDMIHLRAGSSGGGFWTAGNFGFLDLTNYQDKGSCDGLSGGQLTRCLLGANNFSSGCFPDVATDTTPGQGVGINDIALNVRFDIYSGNYSGEANNELYAPAPNVISGYKGGPTCERGGQNTDSTNTVPLPNDTCIDNGTCTTERFGDGNWDKNYYLEKNYLQSPTFPNPVYTDGTNTVIALNSNDIPEEIREADTRYELYLAEIAVATEIETSNLGLFDPENDFEALAPDTDEERKRQLRLLKQYSVLGTNRDETIRPQCNTTGPSSATPPLPTRRVVNAAGVRCFDDDGNAIVRGNSKNVQVLQYLEVFMTRALGKGRSANDIYVEVIRADAVDLDATGFQRIVELKH